jgi:hypothetical protein
MVLSLEPIIHSHLKPVIDKVSFNDTKSRLCETHVRTNFMSGFVIWEALINV